MSAHPEPPTNVPPHLPECERVRFVDAAKEQGWYDDLPEDLRGSDLRFMRCPPHCPALRAAVEYGRELSAHYGWAKLTQLDKPQPGEGEGTDG